MVGFVHGSIFAPPLAHLGVYFMNGIRVHYTSTLYEYNSS